MKKNFTLLELTVLIMVIIVLMLILFPSLFYHNGNREGARRISCASNLKCIGLSLKQYAMENDDKFPHLDGNAGLDMLRENCYITDYKIFCCPSTIDTGRNSEKSDAAIKSSYIYLGGLTEADSADSSIMWDKPDNHKNYGNILFLDGHVKGISASNWMPVKLKETK